MTDGEEKEVSLREHEKYHGKLSVESKVPLESSEDMSIFYSPGVAWPCLEIKDNPSKAYEYTNKADTIAVVTDGSAVLGLGNIGSLAGLPVMEGKCALFKEFGGVNAVPICLESQDTDEIVACVKNIAVGFGGINLEDISAPRCFEIEERLNREIDIPVFHDDQHGTAIVCLAGLINALKVVGKKADLCRVVISGAGAAGLAIANLLLEYGFKELILVDSKGILHKEREDLNKYKKAVAERTNVMGQSGGLSEAVRDSDVFIGVSKPDVLSEEMVKTMRKDPIIFAMSNPDPEIDPEKAKSAGARIIATGRSDLPNQINNVLVFPGLFKGLLEVRASEVTMEMKLFIAKTLAGIVEKPTEEKVIPSALDKSVVEKVAEAVRSYVSQNS